jgi:hypothetical protein
VASSWCVRRRLALDFGGMLTAVAHAIENTAKVIKKRVDNFDFDQNYFYEK